MNYFEIDNRFANAEMNYDQIAAIIDEGDTLLEKIERLFCVCFNLDELSDFDPLAYAMLNEKLKELTTIVESPFERGIVSLCSYYIEMFKVQRWLDDPLSMESDDIDILVDTLSEIYKTLNGLKEDDFEELRYQFVFDYETDVFWAYVKELYNTVGGVSRFGHSNHPFALFDVNNTKAKRALVSQIRSYKRNPPENKYTKFGDMLIPRVPNVEEQN